ncbi:GntR family transcriptional regulator [Pelagibacterium luteolum]|uniref:DNA-binding transcriptional regulator, GntR family n=1 Tax=Pelagibacterium luteolum TaxID=440168 RepID=A0A1G7XY09_9HYPH|nr:GntR family transcriptional regulator [Pelagibacterium luteolum]SDG88973.1 DNA-binding transcriptional regulator, GntR family [Pelagibacterium luteolum]
MSELALRRNPSLVTMIFERLETMILSGQLQSGEPINERALSQQFEVSRAPIREACRRLEQAGLVTIIENRGVFVREISKQAAHETYEIAHLLSIEAAKKATENVTDDDLARLRTLALRIEADASDNDLASYYTNNDNFHVELVRLGGNSKSAEVYRALNNELTLYRQRGLRRLPDFERSLAAHRRILEALEKRDRDAYVAALEAHSSNMTDRLLNLGV